MNTWTELISETIRSEPLRLNFPYSDIRDLLPVAVIVGISILLSVLWLLAVWEYTWLKGKYLPKS